MNIMKQINILCALAFFLIACSQENMCDQQVVGQRPFSACTEVHSVMTRTSLNGDLSSVWSEGDQIGVFQGNSQVCRYQVDDGYIGQSYANFNFVGGSASGGQELGTNIAVYPYHEDLNCIADGAVYRISGFAYPSVQQYCYDSFAESSYAMAAITYGTEDYDLEFRNVGGAVKLQLIGNDVITKISLTGNNAEKLSGEATLTVYSDGTVPSVQMAQDAELAVSLDCGEGVHLSIDDPMTFYVALPPTSFAKGFTVELENTEGAVCTLEASAANVVGRSQILCMPVATVEFSSGEAQEGDYVDEYGINWGQGVIIDGIRWAPVNCGYKEPSFGEKGYPYGKMYQWGRLYGVGYSTAYDSSAADKAEGGTITIAEANVQANANIFYTVDSGNNLSHWFSDTDIEGVWNAGPASAPLKSAYDPCPEGWRVPTQTEMKSLTSKRSPWTQVNGVSGYWFSGSQTYAEDVPAIFLPAAGYISNTARAQVRDMYGRYWASTVRTTDNLVYQLAFSSSNSNMSYTGTSYGHSVRCVAIN
jgi:uncharacterized protein (TIGR02145 family)